MSHTTRIEQVPTTTAAVTRFHLAATEMGDAGDRMSAALGTVFARLGAADLAPAGPAIAHYRAAGDGYDVCAGFRVEERFDGAPGLERLELPGGEVAHLTHLGPYSQLRAAYEHLQAEIADRGRKLVDGPMWEEYWSPPGTPDEQTRTEVFWPVAAA